MVRVGAFCIDSTEVTSDQYAEFINSSPQIAGQPVECAWNAKYTPETEWPIKDAGELPMSWVDWCDAYAYCAWAGKRLCGKIGGGPNPYDASALTQSEWYFACSGGGQRTFPYGTDFQLSACAVTEAGPGEAGAEKVGSRSACVGGFEGLFDLSGNVAEWEDSCDPTKDLGSDIDGSPAGSGDACRTRGGSYDDRPLRLHCASDDADPNGRSPRPRSRKTARVGIRCCSD
jgi:formylglycine-generating enzyme required for sulfatase activity